MIRLNDVYAKLVNGQLEEAPTDKDGISNYNTDVDRLLADGYKKVIWSAEPEAVEGKIIETVYLETADNIIEGKFLVNNPEANKLTPLEFMNRFNDSELAAIYTASKTVIQIEIWLAKFNRASFIDISDALTIAGLQGLEGAGLIGVGRANQILKL